METPLSGLHHVTAICGDPQRNIAFYTGILGLRLVKVTVNFDDPTSYHFYYGDGIGSPGTILTFFAWPDAPRGALGVGQIARIGFTVPENALAYWQARLAAHGIVVDEPVHRFEESVLTLHDPDGLVIELIAHLQGADRPGWTHSEVTRDAAIRGLHAVTLWEVQPEHTATFLQHILGFAVTAHQEHRTRYSPTGGPGTFVDVLTPGAVHRGRIAVGTTHHVAWRVATDAGQHDWRNHLTQAGAHVTAILDRRYFHSIYFLEPGGVLFEIATDPPGFTLDESAPDLGTHLQLPPWLEAQREELETTLPAVAFPAAVPEWQP